MRPSPRTSFPLVVSSSTGADGYVHVGNPFLEQCQMVKDGKCVSAKSQPYVELALAMLCNSAMCLRSSKNIVMVCYSIAIFYTVPHTRLGKKSKFSYIFPYRLMDSS